MKLLTAGEVEEKILDISEALETATYEYASLSDDASVSEADYKVASATAMLRIVGDPAIKLTADVRQAKVDVECADPFRAWKLAESRRQSKKEFLLSLRARLDAMRSLSASIRSQT